MPTNTQTPVFDQLDSRIINALAGNIRAEAAKIARLVDANERTVRLRINRLLELGAINLVAQVNPAMFGYQHTIIICLSVEPQHEQEVIEQLVEMPSVAYLAYGHGDHDIMLQAHFKKYSDVRQFVYHTLPTLPGLTVETYNLVPHVVCHSDAWLPKPADFSPARPENGYIRDR